MSSIPISHVGIAVADLEAAMKKYTVLLGREAGEVEEVAEQKVRVAIFSGEDPSAGGRIELVTGTSEDSPISKFIAKRGEGLHHVCVFVDDIEQTLVRLKEAGLRLIDEKPRQGAEGKKIAFVHPSATGGVLLELEERAR